MYSGAQTIVADAPISNIPVFVKEGSIIVTGPVMQYSTEKAADSLTITIYGKKDATFVLYEDENENYNYENGKSASIKFMYNANTNAIEIGDSMGSFDGMLTNRVFKLVFINGNSSISKQVNYNGKKVVIKF
jgi:alpha-D-xyloside xylohydrolase